MPVVAMLQYFQHGHTDTRSMFVVCSFVCSFVCIGTDSRLLGTSWLPLQVS
eukprot:m.355673 g.355673  ORF g.355673 m.355673 type:complete len:51 (-) comp17302_c0_seq1:1395-1547(-)